MRARFQHTFLYTVLVTLLILLLSRTPLAAGDHRSFPKELEAALPRLIVRYHVPGVSVALIEDGEIAAILTQGWADVAQQTPITQDTTYQVASISKCLTAWGVLKLVEQGYIGLDDPVEDHLTRWTLPPSPYDSRGVTVRRLLNHTAGLSLSGYGAGRTLDEPLPTLEASLSGDTKGAGAVELVREPGTGFAYSGGGYTLLQLLVEELTGLTFADYMRAEVLQPLGMEDSAFGWNADMQRHLARAYGTYGRAIPNYRYVEHAAGGLYSTIDDMALYAQAVLSGPSSGPASAILSPESFALMFAGERYGLGHGLIDLPTGQRLIFGGGTRTGWQSDFVLHPDGRSGIVILSNGSGGLYLNLALINLWVKHTTGITWPGAEFYLLQHPILVGLVVLTGLGCVASTAVLYRQFRAHKRVWLFARSGTADRGSIERAARALLTGLLLCGILVAWLAGLTPIFDHQQTILWLPRPSLYVALFGTCLVLAAASGLLFPKPKRNR